MFAATLGGGVSLYGPLDFSFVGSVTGDVTLSLTGLPLQEDDFVLLLTGWGQNVTGDPTVGPTTSGYTSLVSVRDTTNDFSVYLGYKFMGSTPDSSVTVAASGYNSLATNTIAYVWRGINRSTPIAATTTTFTAASGAPNPPSISFLGSCTVVVATLALDGPITAAPSGMSKLVTRFTTPGSARSAVAVAAIRTTSPYDPGSFTSSSTGVPYIAMTVPLNLA